MCGEACLWIMELWLSLSASSDQRPRAVSHTSRGLSGAYAHNKLFRRCLLHRTTPLSGCSHEDARCFRRSCRIEDNNHALLHLQILPTALSYCYFNILGRSYNCLFGNLSMSKIRICNVSPYSTYGESPVLPFRVIPIHKHFQYVPNAVSSVLFNRVLPQHIFFFPRSWCSCCPARRCFGGLESKFRHKLYHVARLCTRFQLRCHLSTQLSHNFFYALMLLGFLWTHKSFIPSFSLLSGASICALKLFNCWRPATSANWPEIAHNA